jgi:hypothetical protein
MKRFRNVLVKTTMSLQNEVSQLGAIRVTSQEERIATLEATQTTQVENQLIQFQLIDKLREATRKFHSKVS